MSSHTVNPEMLTLARESRGLTQTVLAKKSGITQYNISRYEGGLIPIPEVALKRLSEVLKHSLSFFYQQDRRHATDLFYRKRKALPVAHLRKIEAEMNILRMHVEQLLRNVEIDVLNSFDCATLYDWDVSPKDLASRLRLRWGAPMGPVPDLVQLLESAGGIVIPLNFETPKIDAISLRGNYFPLFFVNMQVPGDRMRFTLAHEIGHVLMHAIPGPDDEAEANQFASAFLLPEEAVLADLRPPINIRQLAQLKAKWKVSMQAMIMRASDLRVITEKERQRLFMRMSQLGYRKREPVPIAPEQPRLLGKLLDFHQEDLHYSVDELCKTLNIWDDREFNRLYYPERLRFRIA